MLAFRSCSALVQVRSVVPLHRGIYSYRWSFVLPRFHSAKPGEAYETPDEIPKMKGHVMGVGREGRRVDPWKAKQMRFTRHITNLVRKGKVEEAEGVFQDMLSAKVRPSTVIFNNLISGLSRSGHAHRAFKYFNDLKKRGLPPSNHTYTSLFRAFTEMGPSSRPLLEKVAAEVDRRDFLLNTIATNSLMVAMTTCGMTDEVFVAYGDMSRRREAPDVNTFTVLLTACSQDQTRGMERVEHVWREMTAFGVKPDLVCYHALLRCLRVAGIPEEIKERGEMVILLPALDTRELVSLVSQQSSENSESLHEILPRTDVLNRDTNAVNSRRRNNTKCDPFEVVSDARVNLRLFGSGVPPLTIHVTESGLRWVDPGGVAKVLSVMSEEGLKPDKRTLDHLSKIAGDWSDVVKGVVGGACDEETNRGVAKSAVVPDEKCLVSAIHMQVRLGNGRAAEVLRRFGEEAGILSGSARYRLLALGCRTQHDSHSLLTQMKEAGVTPDTHTMGVLLRDAAGRLDYECLTALMKEMRHRKLEPDGSILRILAKVADGRVPKSPRMKLRFNGFKGYYTLWKKHYPQLESRDPHVRD